MVQSGGAQRFTIALKKEVYRKLKKLAEEARPPLSLQYVASLAIVRFLDESERSGIKLEIGGSK